MTAKDSLLSSRFRATLLGVLVGDCCGAPFEGSNTSPTTLAEKIDGIISGNKPSSVLRFTDDTAMTKSTCRSLIKNKGFNPRHMAMEYTESYFKEPGRGYGGAVRQVFTLLRDIKYQDPYGPASTQFDGSGSFGNGAAMRCSGLALFAHKNKFDDKKTLDLVENCSRITHSHVYGIHGAVLLVAAIKYVLALEEDGLNENDFLDHLIIKMGKLENASDTIFSDKLKSMKRVIEQMSINGTDITQKEIVRLLGNDVSAQSSVPLAIYSFLRGNSKFTDSYRLENEFIRTLHWAISCGGDTDTIASMACGLCGAYLGTSKIPENLYKSCESWQEMISLADQLLGQ